MRRPKKGSKNTRNSSGSAGPAAAIMAAVSKLERFVATAQQKANFQAAKKAIGEGRQKGLNKAESLKLLDSLQNPKGRLKSP